MKRIVRGFVCLAVAAGGSFAASAAVAPISHHADWGYMIGGLGADGNETAVVFTNWNAAISWTLSDEVESVQLLVVAGGGSGGGNCGGGGGGGGVATCTLTNPAGTYSIRIGAGGSGSSGLGKSGGNSSISNGAANVVTAFGGGGGGQFDSRNAMNGGSGGGTSGPGTRGLPVAAEFGEGVADGVSYGHQGGASSNYAEGGGGGGAGEDGGNGNNTVGGKGGDGILLSITGDTVCYGAGGGGGGTAGTAGAGGAGGGGSGSTGGAGKLGKGAANLGAGGGGSRNGTSGVGGSGVVILRYVMPPERLNLPVLKWTSFSFSGEEFTPTNFYGDVGYMTVGGTVTASAIGQYAVALTPKEGYVWTDGTRRTIEVPWCIHEAPNVYPLQGHADWGYRVVGLGLQGEETAVVFTNKNAEMVWSVPGGVPALKFLAVGGGGSGGLDCGGGGGSGGVLEGRIANPTGEFSIRLGAGGKGVTTTVCGNSGEATVISNGAALVATVFGGGGGGTFADKSGRTGGSGGGASNCGGSGQPGVVLAPEVGDAVSDWISWGNKGGVAGVHATGAGGGGAGSVGGNSDSGVPGEPGAGIVTYITDSAWTVGAGGAGSTTATGSTRSGVDGTGDGGGAIYRGTSGRGGSGIVVIRGVLPLDEVPLPKLTIRSVVYTGAEFFPTNYLPNIEYFDVSGTLSASEIGNYVLMVAPKPGYMWPNKSRATVSVGWNITPPARIRPIKGHPEWGYQMDRFGFTGGDVCYVFTNHLAAIEWEVPSKATMMDVLVVAGGGSGGGNCGGGGGGGGVATCTLTNPAGTYSIRIGAGGSGSSGLGKSGGNSSISNGAANVVTAFGGGGGGYFMNNPGLSGGSGGASNGSGARAPVIAAEFGEGIADGVSYGHQGGSSSVLTEGGGGGGALEEGGNGDGTTGGKGGDGIPLSVTGEIVRYGAGGGGGGTSGMAGAGGADGGGSGGSEGGGVSRGAANLGAGGGGSRSGTSGAGGSGIVIFHYVRNTGSVLFVR